VRRATLSDLLHAKAALTPEMALRIEKAFGPDMNHLLRMQLAYDVAKTRGTLATSQSSGTSGAKAGCAQTAFLIENDPLEAVFTAYPDAASTAAAGIGLGLPIRLGCCIPSVAECHRRLCASTDRSSLRTRLALPLPS